MHRADRPVALPATFAGIGVFVRHSQEPLRPDSRDERLAIEAGAFAQLEVRAPADSIGRTPTTAMPRPQQARGAIRS